MGFTGAAASKARIRETIVGFAPAYDPCIVTNMEFIPLSLSELIQALTAYLPDAYAGGSHQLNPSNFMSYLSGKRLKTLGKTVRAQDVFNTFCVAHTTSVKHAENRLLQICASHGCNYTSHEFSNRYAEPGYVYVLCRR